MANRNSADHRPVLILLSGLPGSGKTTFARALAGRLPLRHVESDRIRRGISAQPSYTRLESSLVFARVEAEVRGALADGCIALQDATNLTNNDRRRFLRLGAETGALMILIRLVAPEATIRERLGVPRVGHSQAGLEVYERMRERPELIPAPVLVVDTRFPLEPALELVVKLIAATAP
jgi:predicted kinase